MKLSKFCFSGLSATPHPTTPHHRPHCVPLWSMRYMSAVVTATKKKFHQQHLQPTTFHTRAQICTTPWTVALSAQMRVHRIAPLPPEKCPPRPLSFASSLRSCGWIVSDPVKSFPTTLICTSQRIDNNNYKQHQRVMHLKQSISERILQKGRKWGPKFCTNQDD